VAGRGFYGTYTPRMDDKGRVTLPARYRDDFAGGVMLTKGQDHCLFVLTPDGFEQFAADAITADVTDEWARGYQRFMLANTDEQRPDGQGRITVPPIMREYARLSKDVVITGVGLRMEIWDAAEWRSYEALQEAAYASPVRGTMHPD
jgi:MraZ protein